MECHWCERETDNEMTLETNGYGKQVWVAYCEKCSEATIESLRAKKSTDDSLEIISNK